MSDISNVLGDNFYSDQYEPLGDFSPVPPGEYKVSIDQAEVKPTKNFGGHYIYLKLVILEGEFKGRSLLDFINIDNQNSKCVEIGKRTLSALARSVNINDLSDSAQLVGRNTVAHVKVAGNYNEIRTYSSIDKGTGTANRSVTSPSGAEPQGPPSPGVSPFVPIPQPFPWARPSQ